MPLSGKSIHSILCHGLTKVHLLNNCQTIALDMCTASQTWSAVDATLAKSWPSLPRPRIGWSHSKTARRNAKKYAARLIRIGKTTGVAQKNSRPTWPNWDNQIFHARYCCIATQRINYHTTKPSTNLITVCCWMKASGTMGGLQSK